MDSCGCDAVRPISHSKPDARLDVYTESGDSFGGIGGLTTFSIHNFKNVMGAKISHCMQSPHSAQTSLELQPRKPIYRFITLMPLNKNPLYSKRSKWATVSFDASTNDSFEDEEALPDAVNQSFVKASTKRSW